jgi:glycosyltransferase involved in cell wall biosynthesis
MTEQNIFQEISDAGRLVNEPLVSVLIFSYRYERFIAQAINGILAQTCNFPIEIIIGEDCSPDDSLSISLDYQRRNPELIRVLTGPMNVGAGQNVERCLAASRGQYITMCDGDDYWCDPTKLTRQIEIFRANPQCTLVFHAAAYVDSETGNQVRTSRQSLFSRMLSTEEVILGDGGLMPTASILVRREIALDPPLWYREAPVGDYPLALRAALRGKIAYLDRTMSVYRTNVPHSWTQRYVPDINSRMQYARQIEVMFSGFSTESGHRFDEATREMVSKYYSDPLVRLPGSAEEKRRLYSEVSDKLRGSDRWLTWLAVKCSLRLPLLKNLLRKSRSLRRLIKAHIFSERIAADHAHQL